MHDEDIKLGSDQSRPLRLLIFVQFREYLIANGYDVSQYVLEYISCCVELMQDSRMGLKDTVTEREAAQLNNDGVVRDVDPNYASEKDIKS